MEGYEKMFSKADKNYVAITPLGAAIVEALPDQKAVRRIKMRFKKYRECPASMIFNPQQVMKFYKDRGEEIHCPAG